jgi:hypothetical protein
VRNALVTVGVVVALGAASTASADVQLTIQGGRVRLVAKDATVGQILAEWARVGQTTIINGERIPGGPVTLELIDVPEQRALEVLLRAASDYLAAPRAAAADNLSVFDRIHVLPTSATPPAPSSTQPPAAFAQPSFPPPFPPADDQNGDGDVVPGVTPPNRGPVFTFPPPQVTGPQPVATPTPQVQPQQVVPQPAAPAAFPPAVPYPGAPTSQAPAGVAVPGMVVPAPAPQPGQPIVVFPGQQPTSQPQR